MWFTVVGWAATEVVTHYKCFAKEESSDEPVWSPNFILSLENTQEEDSKKVTQDK